MHHRTLASSLAGRLTRILASAAVGAVLTVTLTAAGAPAVGPHARPGAVTDHKFPLNSVSVVSSSDAWAVGTSADSLTNVDLLHWNGTSWAPVTIPGLPAGVGLSVVDAVSVSDVWAAGGAGSGLPGSSGSTLIVHWNGTTWTRVRSPAAPKGFSVNSMSMDSVNDGWAVGSIYNPKTNTNTSLAWHWNGTSWQQVTASAVSAFSGVASFSPSDATAVGWTSGHVSVAAAFHWNGTSWALAQTLPSPSGVSASLLAGFGGLSAPSATDMWTVGAYFGNAGAARNLAWHWNGRRWTVMAVPSPGIIDVGLSGLAGVTAISPTNVWAVGFTDVRDPHGTHQATVAVHWNGTSWTQAVTPNPGIKEDAVLLGVAAAGPGNIWAVGYFDARGAQNTLILRWNGTGWVQS